MGPDQRDLLSFHHVAFYGSFTKAAEILNVSKGHISKSVSRLELQLQNKLFQRSTRQLVLTDAGEQLFATTTAMQETLDKGLERLQVLSGIPKGDLKISAPPAFSEAVLAPIFSQFMAQYPGVTIDLDLESKLVDVISGGYDLVLRGARLEDSNLIARKLLDVENILVASPSLFNKHDQPQFPEDLEKLPCIAYRTEGKKIIWQFNQGRKRIVVDIKPMLTCNLSSLLKAWVLNGVGVTNLPLFMVKKELKNKQLQMVFPKWRLPSLPLYLVYPSREYLPLKTRCFINFLLAKLSSNQNL